MKILLKLLLIIVVLGALAQMGSLYFALVIAGNYIYNAPVFNIILVAVAWPLASLIVAWYVLKWGFKLIHGDY